MFETLVEARLLYLYSSKNIWNLVKDCWVGPLLLHQIRTVCNTLWIPATHPSLSPKKKGIFRHSDFDSFSDFLFFFNQIKFSE